MITSFKDKETEKIWEGLRSKKLPNDIQNRALNKLRLLNAARCLEDLKRPPSNNLEKLKGKKEQDYSIRINDQWRICFKWNCNHSHDVTIIDYHKRKKTHC